jgi:hypothetical protein
MMWKSSAVEVQRAVEDGLICPAEREWKTGDRLR